MDEPILVTNGNSGVVNNNSPGKPFHKGGDALILDPNHQNGCFGRVKRVTTNNLERESCFET
jgi:hypothetical protein